MSRARAFASVLLLGAAAFMAVAYARQAQGYVIDGDPQQPEGEPLEGATGWDWSSLAIPVDDITQAMQDLGTEVFNYQQGQEMPSYSVDANVRAFLETIKLCEGTKNAGEYGCLYGSRPGALRTFSDFSDHPRIAQRISATDQRWTSAAGAYQMMAVSPIPGGGSTKVNTWDRLKKKLGLPDFSPASQDAAAVELLNECGALDRLAVGDFAGAVRRAAPTWASLPGANYAGQGMRSMAQVQAWYSGAGGYAA